jgi:hypothetical protein
MERVGRHQVQQLLLCRDRITVIPYSVNSFPCAFSMYAISSWRCVWDTRVLYFISPDFEIYSSKEAGASFPTHISFFVEFSPKKEKIRRCKLHLTLFYLFWGPYIWNFTPTCVFHLFLLEGSYDSLFYMTTTTTTTRLLLPIYVARLYTALCVCVYTHTHTRTNGWMDEPKWVFFSTPFPTLFLYLYS